jgi:hypothetical protein
MHGSKIAPRRIPLAVLFGSIFGIAAPLDTSAATINVTDCGDGSATGTLRHTILNAPDASTIKIPLACSKVTLTGGAIPIANTIHDMTIVGQSSAGTVIDGSSEAPTHLRNRVFFAQNTGTLNLENLTITHATPAATETPRGGCIYSSANLYLKNVVVSGCHLNPTNATVPSDGAGIFGEGTIVLAYSTITANIAYSTPPQISRGGGIFAKNLLIASGTTVSDNAARGGFNPYTSRGGGIYEVGSAALVELVSAYHNAAMQVGGENLANSGSLIFISSTIAGNVSLGFHAVGSYMQTFVTNSTIAFNRTGLTDALVPSGLFSSYQIAMYNSIFADNRSVEGDANDVFSSTASTPLTGLKNLITATSNLVPPQTTGICPKLGHLSNNGGPTKTIPLLKGSPALDVGTANGQTTDQRGTGFPRTAGSGTDIGAYERQPGVVDDDIFYSEFESPCD